MEYTKKTSLLVCISLSHGPAYRQKGHSYHGRSTAVLPGDYVPYFEVWFAPFSLPCSADAKYPDKRRGTNASHKWHTLLFALFGWFYSPFQTRKRKGIFPWTRIIEPCWSRWHLGGQAHRKAPNLTQLKFCITLPSCWRNLDMLLRHLPEFIGDLNW